ncbi:MAG TPA: outer membrane protein assembly factor BamA [Chitinispirillaceae bacterium]|nr:outer membrane protein assembly factor BamA [Chitinispirillaceae bacterium]
MTLRYWALFVSLTFFCSVSWAQQPDSADREFGPAAPAEEYSPDTQEQVSKIKILDSLAIEGLTTHSPSVVRNALEVRVGKPLNTNDIQESIRKVYELDLFRSVDFYVISENDSSVKLKLQLEEYPICENVEYDGNRKIKTKDFEEKVTLLKKGQIVTDDILYDLKNRVKDLYIEKGYNLAEIKTELVKSKIPGNAFVKLNIKEGPRVRIESIVFKGNNEVKSSKLARKFKTKEHRLFRGGEFNKELYREHLDTLVYFYNDLGFLDASIVKDSVWYGDSKKDINIEIVVDEGKKYYTGDFFFKGNRIIPTDSLETKVSMKRGKPFQKNRFEMTKYLVENTFREEGYLWVRVDEKRHYRGDTIDITFDISEGRPAIVRKIDIKGNSKTMEKVIRREIDLYPGKKYRQSLMLRSRQKIMALNYFNDVKPDLVPNEDGTINLIFDITEKDNIGQLQVGAAYSSESFVGTFSTSIPNFMGKGQKLEINVEYGKRQQNFRLGFTEPWAFDRPILLAGQVFYTRYEYTDGETNKSIGFELTGGLSKLKWPDDNFKVQGSYQFSLERSSIESQNFPRYNLEVPQEGFLNMLSLNISRYDLDLPIFPTRGDRFSIEPQIAWGPGDDFFRFFKGTLSYEHYFPLFGKLVLGSRTNFGLITGLGQDLKIGKAKLFNLGGVLTGDGILRGYPDYEFGGWYNDAPNGLAMFCSSLELRYPLLDQQLYLGVFADAGNTWSGLSKINFGDLYKTVGFGIRINVPMLGVMGFDFGYGLDDIEKNKDPFNKKPHGWKVDILMNRGF